jgi:hypothetical protein
MPYDADYIQQSFSGGELSPAVQGQVDFEKYAFGVDTLLNFVALPQGPAQNRSGTKFIAEARNHAEAIQLIPFRYSVDQAYVIAFNDGYFQFFQDTGQILNQNMVRNGRMEEDAYWTDVGTPTSTAQDAGPGGSPYEGGNCWKIVAAAAGDGVRCAYFTAETGLTYDLDLWVYVAAPDTSIRVRMRKGDDSGWEHDTTYAVTADTWENITASIVATADGALAYVDVVASVAAGSGTF